MPPPASSAPRGSFYDTYTQHHHLRAVLGSGVVAGVLLLNEVIARKGLGASRWHVLALLLAPSLAQFVAAAWNPTDPRRVLGKRPFRALGIPSRLLLVLPLLLPFLQSGTSFVLVVGTCMAIEALLLPVQNSTLASNYAASSRGRRFGHASAVQCAAIIAVVLPAGWLLDAFPEAWPALYAVAGLAGAYGYMHWSRLRRRARRRPLVAVEEHGSPWATLVRDRQFLAFEACFMVYGIGFLMLQPVLPIYLVDELHVKYSQVGIARGLIFFLGMLVASPLLGRLGDRIGTFRMTAYAFLALTLFPLVLLAVEGTWALYVAYGIYGLAMGGVNVAWNIGPIVLARGRDPLPYLNAHVALVGVRALIGMVAGAWIQYAVGTATVFACVVALELVAGAAMLAFARRVESSGEALPGEKE